MGDKDKISGKTKWVISLWSGLVFLIIASSIMYKITGSVFGIFGLKIQNNGCPNWIGLLIHSVVFIILIRVMMEIPIPGTGETFCPSNFHKGYTGLVNPASMVACNRARLYAMEQGCQQCFNAANVCMAQPFKKECNDAITECQSTCKKSNVTKAMNNCHMTGHKDYFPYGSCLNQGLSINPESW